MITREEHDRIDRFVSMSGKQREKMEREDPDLFKDMISLQKRVMSDWEKRFAKKAWIGIGPGRFKKNRHGKMEHPFKSGMFVAFWPRPHTDKMADAKTSVIDETSMDDDEKAMEPQRVKELLKNFLDR